jgi:protein-tyrosine phosphatase
MLATELYNAVISGRKDLVIVDVRSLDQYNANRIDTALHFLAEEVESQIRGKKRTIVVYHETDNEEVDRVTILEGYAPELHTVVTLRGGFTEFSTTAVSNLLCTAKYPSPLPHLITTSVYPNEIITNILYLGSIYHAQDINSLQALGITHVLNLTNFGEELMETSSNHFISKQINITDLPSTDIIAHFEDAFSFINACKQASGRILVHCRMGVSRSASFVIAYLMKNEQLFLKDAHAFVKKRRTVINPNLGFMDQLRRYELTLYPQLDKTTLDDKTAHKKRQDKKKSLYERYGMPFGQHSKQ